MRTPIPQEVHKAAKCSESSSEPGQNTNEKKTLTSTATLPAPRSELRVRVGVKRFVRGVSIPKRRRGQDSDFPATVSTGMTDNPNKTFLGMTFVDPMVLGSLVD